MYEAHSRVALVTGVSRRAGIAAAVAQRLAEDGYRVFLTGWHAHDREMPWASDEEGPAVLVEEMRARGVEVEWVEADLAEAASASRLVDQTVERFSAIDVIVAAHARSSHVGLDDVTAEELDRCYRVNARASVLLAQAFARRFEPSRGHGRLVLFTSGQHLAPMAGEIAYAVSKGALHQMTSSLSDALIDRSVTVNCINPGPVDTGYLDGELHHKVADMFPARRWGQPSDVANLVAWLVSPESAWITGQVIDSEGGFRRAADLGRFD